MKNIISWGGASLVIIILWISNIFLQFLGRWMYFLEKNFGANSILVVIFLIPVVVLLLGGVSIIKEQGTKRRLGVIGLILGLLYFLFALFIVGGSGGIRGW